VLEIGIRLQVQRGTASARRQGNFFANLLSRHDDASMSGPAPDTVAGRRNDE
jgi:hypothetical protein